MLPGKVYQEVVRTMLESQKADAMFIETSQQSISL